jgi:hypothetical protein
MKKMQLVVGIMLLLSIFIAIPMALEAATRTEPALVSVVDGTGTWVNSGGALARLVDVTSTATGGTLTVAINLGVTRADSVAASRQLGSAAIHPPTNVTVSVGTTAYVWPNQSVSLTYGTNITTHTVFLTVEKTE